MTFFQKQIFLEGNYSDSHFFIPVQHMQETIQD